MNTMVVLGASPNPERYSNKAVRRLLANNYSVIPLGIRDGMIGNIPIVKGLPPLKNIHTLLLYIGPPRQKEYYDYILQLKPRRVIFNPGTENPELADLCKTNGIEVVINCALVMIGAGTFFDSFHGFSA